MAWVSGVVINSGGWPNVCWKGDDTSGPITVVTWDTDSVIDNRLRSVS